MRTVRIVALFMMGLMLLPALGGCGGGGGGGQPTPTPWSAEDAALLADLQEDDTDTNPYEEGTYEGEHYARDLQTALEGLDYEVTYLVAFQYDGELTWQPLLKMTHAGGNVSIVDAQHDAIVTAAYDGDGDGVVETLVDQSYEETLDAVEWLVGTGAGSDGQYLIFEFIDYYSVDLVDRTVAADGSGGKTLTDLQTALAEDKTDEKEYVAETHDCDDFAGELEDALEAKGFRVTVKLVHWKEGEVVNSHAIVDVTIGDNDVAIDPQTDGVVTGTYDGNGDGVIQRRWSPSFVDGQAEFTGWLSGTTNGTDGGIWVEEYEDIDDIPFPLDENDPPQCSLRADSTLLAPGGSTMITLTGTDKEGDDFGRYWKCTYGYLMPVDDEYLRMMWYAKSSDGEPLEPGVYRVTAWVDDYWGRKSACTVTLTVVAQGGEEGGEGGPVPTCTGSGSE